mmetsp:Transcript_10860/g.31584  ORF Transcript_10860/g.31584 Transcript_10860/m.31584 type:complete len:240 (+) Transcript_10860:409-1128(+)
MDCGGQLRLFLFLLLCEQRCLRESRCCCRSCRRREQGCLPRQVVPQRWRRCWKIRDRWWCCVHRQSAWGDPLLCLRLGRLVLLLLLPEDGEQGDIQLLLLLLLSRIQNVRRRRRRGFARRSDCTRTRTRLGGRRGFGIHAAVGCLCHRRRHIEAREEGKDLLKRLCGDGWDCCYCCCWLGLRLEQGWQLCTPKGVWKELVVLLLLLLVSVVGCHGISSGRSQGRHCSSSWWESGGSSGS